MGEALDGDLVAVPTGSQAIAEVEDGDAARDLREQAGRYHTAANGTAENERLLQPPSPAAIRAELESAVLRDLLGPAGGPAEEVDESNLRDRYLIGVLAPKNTVPDASDDDDLDVADDEVGETGSVEKDPPLTRSFAPSSFGLTFAVAADTPVLRVTCRWGRYDRLPSEHIVTDKGSPKLIWKRTQIDESFDLPLRAVPRLRREVDPEDRGVRVEGAIRSIGGDWVVSLFLINNQSVPQKRKDSAWLFQGELRVEAPDGAAVFRARSRPEAGAHGKPEERAEEMSLAMLYRGQREFAGGHGVSVAVTLAPGSADRAVRLATQVAPTYELPETTAPTLADIPGLAGLQLDMRLLAIEPLDDILAGLRVLPAAYGEWIAARKVEAGDPNTGLTGYGSIPLDNLRRCERAMARIHEGIALVASDPRAEAAFRFMNQAMWQQRTHSLFADGVRRWGAADLSAMDVPANRSWRPFQIAFILINLPGLTQLDHPERALGAEATADLLWFPTGGGKTEAYLGLTAYTLAIRRLQGTVAGHNGEHGVAVLMRYTLRLLTLQQFQRAAALICACEAIRRAALADGDARWGKSPFRIGLWVGRKTTPNSTEDSSEAVKRSLGQYNPGSASGSPAQLTNCPWCGSPIDPGKDILVESFSAGRGRTLIYCGHISGDCLFSRRQAQGEGLPVLVVDEEIYRLLPSLLIATVDKFAQMPWRGATQMLFGRVTGLCPRHGFRSPDLEDSDSHPKKGIFPAVRTQPHPRLRPPDLIIQDELHLISGPLGAMVGLYETAVDHLAAWEVDGRPVRPKVIASTATIRRAGEQMHALFLRSVAVFPPQGIDAGDNFFSRRIVPDAEHPGRRYMGICAPGRRLKAALIRVYVAYLAAAQQLYVKYGAVTDPWMTLVGYFNSMRELGGMRRLVDDDVRSRLQRMDRHGLAKRGTPRLEELTSRKNATDIPRLLDRLEVRFDGSDLSGQGGKGVRRPGATSPLDVLLATNMVSVGVDVKRLGLMVVANQPKSIAEYIQATSRVGRSFPGLVCTVYNWARPRDLSHYERFAHAHATMYQHVEALSVTPFAPRALDRGLASLLVALMRLEGPEFAANAGAGSLTYEHPLFKAAAAAIAARAVGVDGAGVRQRVEQDLSELIETWIARARNTIGGQKLGYKPRKDGLTLGLLSQPTVGEWLPFTCLNSVRDVEPQAALILDDRSLDDSRVWEMRDEGVAVTHEEDE